MRGPMRWLRGFFYSGDPDVKFLDGLNEFEASSYEELLANNGIVAMRKNMEALYDRYWRPVLFAANHFALFVKQSDLERAREILGPLVEGYQPGERVPLARRFRRRPKHRT